MTFSLGLLVSALLKGRSLPNETGWKWFGAAATALALSIVAASLAAVSLGWAHESISLDTAFQLAGALLGLLLPALYTQFATTTKIGFGAARERAPGAPEQLRDDPLEPVPADPDPTLHARSGRADHDGIDARLGAFRGD